MSAELQDLVDLLHYRILLGFEDVSLGRLAVCCQYFNDIAAEQALWRRLATCSDRLAAARYLGVLSPEAGEVVSTDSDPPARHNRRADDQSTIDWRDVCRQLHASVAVRPWDISQERNAESCPGVWAELTDGWHNGRNVDGLPEGGIYASQSPSLFWVGGNQLLAVAGIYFRESVGGGEPRELHDVYFVNILDEDLRAGATVELHGLQKADMNGQIGTCEGWLEDTSRWSVRMENGQTKAIRRANLKLSHVAQTETPRARRRRRRLDRNSACTAAGEDEVEDPRLASHPCGVRIERLDCGNADGALPRGHPTLNGAASDFDPIRRTAYFFGGGSPHAACINATSALRLAGWAGPSTTPLDTDAQASAHSAPTARWEVVQTPGTVAAGTLPSGRQGLRGVVFRDEFVIFGGRGVGRDACLNDVWSLDLSGDRGAVDDGDGPRSTACNWRQLVCEGTAPSPRVWYSACHAVHGKWFIYGGSTFQFEEPEEAHDYQVVFILDLAARSWSSIDPQPGPGQPSWMLGASSVALGGYQMLLLGGVKPHKVGAEGITDRNLEQWRTWYERLDEPHLFDLSTGSWSKHPVGVLPTTPSSSQENHIMNNYLRAQFAAAFVPTRRSVVVFGGSRYFTGEYFNDILELHLPAATSASQRTSVLGKRLLTSVDTEPFGEFQAEHEIPRFLQQMAQRGERRMTRGLLGRLRGLTRDGILPQQQFERLVQEL